MLPWRRHRRTPARLPAAVLADAWQVCSLLLAYPDDRLTGRLPLLREAAAGLPADVRGPLDGFLDHVTATLAAGSGLGALQRDYVDTFDVTRKCALHLTYFLHGDTRNRGVALVRFKQLYREHGVELAEGGPDAGELPDHLSVVLEFGACVAPDAAWKLLNDHRVGIELLHRALARRDSPWVDVVRALRATLPALDGDDEAALARLIAEGPPSETVGLDDAALNAPYAHDPGLEEAVSGGHGPPAHGAGCDHGHGSSPAAGGGRHTPALLGTTIGVGGPR